MAEEIQHKTGRGYLVKAASDNGVGTVEAIVSVFGVVDSYKERVMPGYFAESIMQKMPKGVWMHDWTDPICLTKSCEELMPGDPRLPEDIKLLGGLLCVGEFHKDIEDSWQAYLKIAKGYVDEYSFGYKNTTTSYDEETGITDLIKGTIYEWSPVLVGANRATQTLSVKSILSDVKRVLDQGPANMQLDEHVATVQDAVAGLIKRMDETTEKRVTSGSVTATFINRLGESATKFADLAAKARDAAAPQAPTTDLLEWEASKHALRLREIRSKAS